MSVVLSRQIILTPEQKQIAIQKLREAFAEYQRSSRRQPAKPRPLQRSRRRQQRGRPHHEGAARIGASFGSLRWRRRVVVAGAAQPAARRAQPKRAARGAASSDIARRRAEDLRRAGRPRRVLHVLVGRPLGTGLRLRRARRCVTSSTIPVFTPYPATGYGFDDDTKKMLGDADLGRRAPSGAVGDQRRLRRPLAVRQRDERPHRAHRPARLQDQADPRADAERVAATTPRRSSRRTPNTR